MNEEKIVQVSQNEVNKKKEKNIGDAFACERLNFAGREAYKKLRTNVFIALANRPGCQIVGITSAQPSEGKSLTSINLTWAIASAGKKVLLLDGDMRRPSIHSKMGVSQTPGLSALLTKDNDVRGAIHQHSDGTNVMDFIVGGEAVNNSSELLDTSRMTNLLSLLKKSYEYIILDLPPVGAVTDAVTVTKNLDGMIVVVREKNCPRPVLNACIEQLKFSKVNILGFVVNGAREGAGKNYGYSSYY